MLFRSVTDIPLQQLLSASLSLEGWKHNKPKSSTFRRIPPQFIGERGRRAKLLQKRSQVVGGTTPGRRGRPRLQKKTDESGLVGDQPSVSTPVPKEKGKNCSRRGV